MEATEDQSFQQESLPFRKARTLCPNCHARFQRRVIQFVLACNLVMGLAGGAMIGKDPSAGPGHVFFNLFLFETFFILATLPHELGHALAGRQLRIEVQKVILGFGTTLFARKWLGFSVEIKRIPSGGFTIGFPLGTAWVRTRYFLFVLAGPLSNFVLAAGAYFLVPEDSKTFNLERTLNPWWPFLLANLTVVIITLIPFVASSPYGPLPSDGLALIQLAVLRRLPFVPKQEPGAYRSLARALRHVTKWTAAAFLSLCGLLCFGFAILLSKDLLSKDADAGLWFAACFLAGLGATFAWSVHRVWRIPIVSLALNPYAMPSPHSELLREYQAEVALKSRSPDGFSTALLLSKFRGLRDEMKLDEAEQLIAEAMHKAPQNLTLLIHRVGVLASAARWRDMETVLGSILLQTDLNHATRTVLFTGQIEAALNQEDGERGRNMVKSFLDHQPSLPEKLYLLDRLSCLPFMSGLRHTLPDADKWSELALQLQPENLSFKGTRGAILIEQGKYAEGDVLLKEVLEKSEADIDKGVASLFLALSAKHRNDGTSAMRLARRAKLIYPVPWLLKRIESEFGKIA